MTGFPNQAAVGGCLAVYDTRLLLTPTLSGLNEKEPVKFEDSKSLLLFLRRGTHCVVQLEKTRVSFRHATCNAWEPNDAVFLVLITGLFSTPSPATSLAFHPRILIHSLPVASNLLRRSSCLSKYSHSSVKKGQEKKRSKPKNVSYTYIPSAPGTRA